MGRMEKGNAMSSRFIVAPQPEAVIDLRGVVETLRRQLKLIFKCLVAGAILGVVVALVLPARYEAKTEVFLDPRNLVVLQNEISPTIGTGEESALISQSQAQMVRSTDVLKSVVASLALEKDPDFGRPEPGLFESIKQTLFGPGEASTSETPEVKAIRALNRDLVVRRTDKTFVIEIGVKTSDADKSALVANTLASAFIKEVSRTRSLEVQRAGKALDGRLAELRGRLQVSDDAVETYRRRHDLIGTAGRPLNEQQLGELTSQLSNAQRDATAAKSRLDAIRSLRRGDDLPADTEESIRSVALAQLRTAYAQAKRAADEAAVTYGPRFPATKELAARVASAKRQLDAELMRINRSAETDLQRARSTAAALGEKLGGMKETSGRVNEATVQLRELEREAGANRAVYESFLNRSRELQQRLYLDTVNARVVTVALPPLARSGLPRSVVVLIGLVAGALLGVILALLRSERPPQRHQAFFAD